MYICSGHQRLAPRVVERIWTLSGSGFIFRFSWSRALFEPFLLYFAASREGCYLVYRYRIVVKYSLNHCCCCCCCCSFGQLVWKFSTIFLSEWCALTEGNCVDRSVSVLKIMEFREWVVFLIGKWGEVPCWLMICPWIFLGIHYFQAERVAHLL